jgi:hypothetical protein
MPCRPRRRIACPAQALLAQTHTGWTSGNKVRPYSLKW